MKKSGDSDRNRCKGYFWRWVLIFFGLMLVLYLYFMLGSLSSAPKFVYTEF